MRGTNQIYYFFDRLFNYPAQPSIYVGTNCLCRISIIWSIAKMVMRRKIIRHALCNTILIETQSLNMLKPGFLKPELSIQKIGKLNFWIGIVVGISLAVILSFGINYTREAFRISTFSSDLHILPENEYHIYDFFFAVFSTCIGFGFALFYWLRSSKLKPRKNHLRILAISLKAC